MFSLGIDTSNYATSLAVVDTTCQEVVCTKKRFLPVKQGELGLRQSDALFHHTVALPQLFSEMRKEFDLKLVTRVGVSVKPREIEGSYMPCFLVGESFSMALSAGLSVPLVKTTHQQGHVQAAILGAGLFPLKKEALVFHISGGTTDLLWVNEQGVAKTIGTSLDLYAGQAVDRLGVQLGFDFPAGERVSELAEHCEEKISPKVSVINTNCHLSGLQNQYERLIEEGRDSAYVAKYCLLFIAYTVRKMVENARKEVGMMPLICAGGVMSSSVIRNFLNENIENVYFAPPYLSSDNAVGVALIASKEVFCGGSDSCFGVE